jgi:hypothetical protein
MAILYLLDANVLITAQNQYYPIDMVPEFWDWLVHMADSNRIKMPLETFEEVKEGHEGDLFGWINAEGLEQRLVLAEEVDVAIVQQVIAEGYARDLSDTEIEQVGEDPFLIAYARAQPASRCVVSAEGSKPSRVRANRHIPDVCAAMGVQCCHPFAMLRALGFSTGWKTGGNGKAAAAGAQPNA